MYETDEKGKVREVKVPILHFQKTREGIVALRALIAEGSDLVRAINAAAGGPLRNYLSEARKAKDRINSEIEKMEEALQWTEDYRADKKPPMPGWAKNYK